MVLDLGDILLQLLLNSQWWVNQKDMAVEAIKAVKSGEITITPKTSEAEYFHWLEKHPRLVYLSSPMEDYGGVTDALFTSLPLMVLKTIG